MPQNNTFITFGNISGFRFQIYPVGGCFAITRPMEVGGDRPRQIMREGARVARPSRTTQALVGKSLFVRLCYFLAHYSLRLIIG